MFGQALLTNFLGGEFVALYFIRDWAKQQWRSQDSHLGNTADQRSPHIFPFPFLPIISSSSFHFLFPSPPCSDIPNAFYCW